MLSKKFAAAVFAATCGLSASAIAQEDAGPTSALDLSNFSTTFWITNEYMFRGISNSQGAAAQGSLDWTYSGFYLGAWASNTEFSDADVELDFYGGYRFSFAGFGLDIGGLYYYYPGEDEDNFDVTNSFGGCNLDVDVDGDGITDVPAAGSDDNFDPCGGQEADYAEVQLIVSRAFDAMWAPSVAFKYNYSPDTFGEDGDAHAVQGDLGLLIPMGFLGDVGVGGTVGYQTIEGDKSSGKDLCLSSVSGTLNDAVCGAGFGTVLDGFDYVWWRVGVYKIVSDFKVDVSYYGTDMSNDLKTFYPDNYTESSNFSDLIDPHVVMTVSRSFTL